MITLHEIPTDRSLKRRAITLPFWFFMATFLTAVLPVFAPFTALYDVAFRKRLSTTRTLIFFTYFFVLESFGLLIAFTHWLARRLNLMDEATYQLTSRKLQRWWARGAFWGCLRIYSMDISIDGLENLEDHAPAVVLARHASTLDTMLPLAIVRELKMFRYVIKAELLNDPALDIVGQRFPNLFVVRGSKDPEAEINKVLALSQEMEPNAALVMYPEGTRFSAEKRQRLLEKFQDDPDQLAVTQSLQHTLPPLREGSIRLLEYATETDVVFIAHRGIDAARSMASLISGALTHVHLEIKIWRFRAAEVPRDKERIQEFLVENWQRIDRFVHEAYAAHPTAPPKSLPTGN